VAAAPSDSDEPESEERVTVVSEAQYSAKKHIRRRIRSMRSKVKALKDAEVGGELLQRRSAILTPSLSWTKKSLRTMRTRKSLQEPVPC